MTRYICIHGHAYQPPRENVDTGEVEQQPSAAPYHDWNMRISAECYGPLGRAMVLRPDGTTDHRINLWAAMSFDLGPTLGYWMDRQAPDVSDLISEGDRSSGSQSAMAHPWVHAILPLTPERDRATIIGWGLEDFRRRFAREATGMWMPETAVDTATLEAFADHGLTWTLVAPHQLVLEDGSPSGHEPLVVVLPSGREFTVVPYDGALSHGVAFGGMLDDGVRFARAVADGAASEGLTIVSTDIESFGHHHRFGEMALAKAVQQWEAMPDVELTTPSAYLAQFPPTRRGRLVERTSWSCAHGIERWRSDCGCRFEEVPGRDQRWRGPLRDVLDAVAAMAGRVFEVEASADVRDPWEARNAYGSVLAADPLQRPERAAQFVSAHVGPSGDGARLIAWMEAERLRLEAWSSCAWFFDSPDRIETVQTLDQAGSAVARLAELSGRDLVGWFADQVRVAGLVTSA